MIPFLQKCFACELLDTHEKTHLLRFRGLCKHSLLDRVYQIKYDPENIISYIGDQKSTITYDFTANIWKLSDMTNPFVSAELKASFKTLAIGNFLWTINNDTKCQQESYQAILSLTSCTTQQFTCNNGLCINLLDRYHSFIEFSVNLVCMLKTIFTNVPYAFQSYRDRVSQTKCLLLMFS